jgi:hypothetical protein
MAEYYGDFQWKLLKYIVTMLQNDSYLKRITNGRVYPQHISTMENPAFPAVTVSRTGQGSDSGIHQINYVEIAIDVWSKKGIADLWKIYADHDVTNKKPVGVRPLLSQKTFDFPELIVHRSQEVLLVDDLYEDWSKTWHLHARYEMSIAAKNVE